MSISREVALDEMKLTRRHLDQWIEELENPTAIDSGGNVVDAPEVPPGVSVSQMRTIPLQQLKAELAMMAAKLEALAATV